MVDTSSVAFSCSCGSVRGQISPATPQSGTRILCHCRDCRAVELYFDQPDPGTDGVDLFQTSPQAITFSAGTENLGLMKLGPKSTLRWYATCCNTPMFNTLSKPTIPFATAMIARIDDPEKLGPVAAHSFLPQPDGTTKHKGAVRMVWKMLFRTLVTRLSGRWRQTPFFNVETGETLVPAKILTKAERAALYPDKK